MNISHFFKNSDFDYSHSKQLTVFFLEFFAVVFMVKNWPRPSPTFSVPLVVNSM